MSRRTALSRSGWLKVSQPTCPSAWAISRPPANSMETPPGPLQQPALTLPGLGATKSMRKRYGEPVGEARAVARGGRRKREKAAGAAQIAKHVTVGESLLDDASITAPDARAGKAPAPESLRPPGLNGDLDVLAFAEAELAAGRR